MNKQIHEEFRKEMQKAWEAYEPECEPSDIPEPDLSFLDNLDDKENFEDELDLSFLNEKPKKKWRHARFAKVAVLVIGILITSSIVGAFFSVDSAYGVKPVIQKVKQFFSEDESGAEEKVVITDIEDLKKGVKVVRDTYVPQYLPAGYVFEKGEFFKFDGTVIAMLGYSNKDNLITITTDKSYKSSTIFISGDPYTSASGKEMYLEQLEDELTLTYLEGNFMFHVNGDLSIEEAEKIMDNLRPYK